MQTQCDSRYCPLSCVGIRLPSEVGLNVTSILCNTVQKCILCIAQLLFLYVIIVAQVLLEYFHTFLVNGVMVNLMKNLKVSCRPQR